ncbi:MAG: type I-E CRISPR-associated protein Cas7/Cse4/CasC [Chloroflexi bacterium]|nr:MAG: type I-E CRISPR-associated protein Cas7/Cse4/CasC [Chloroflexota bacterium]RLC87365.1 MAG: type I-E CRISPR-associated protein Cas7/Cse4/CasC [Chloroflexota bacterium]
MFVELHIIQNFPPSNLNRDDLGQPKDTDFGGYRRARISSQCLKRATRYAGQNMATGTKPIFERYTGVPLASRTKMIVDGLLKRLTSDGGQEDQARTIVLEFARVYSSRKDKGMDNKKPEQTSVLLYMAEQELDDIADHLRTLPWSEVVSEIVDLDSKKMKPETRITKSPLARYVKEWIADTKGRTSAPDIALFGRMLADKPETNIDAACQVAHAISTHAIDGRTPIDYFTAIDDLKTEPGAGFLDVSYFNSACFYRYSRVDFGQLKKNLGGDHDLACRSVEAFLRASEAAIPPGKKNAYAHECRPSFMLAVLRDKESDGWSLVNAFQKPVSVRSEGDLVTASVKRLEKHFAHLVEFYGDDTVKTFVIALPDGTVEKEQLDNSFRSQVKNMQGWVDAICEPLRQGE